MYREKKKKLIRLSLTPSSPLRRGGGGVGTAAGTGAAKDKEREGLGGRAVEGEGGMGEATLVDRFVGALANDGIFGCIFNKKKIIR